MNGGMQFQAERPYVLFPSCMFVGLVTFLNFVHEAIAWITMGIAGSTSDLRRFDDLDRGLDTVFVSRIDHATLYM